MKPKYAPSQREDTLNQCSDLLRRYNNLENGIRRDRAAVEQLNARIRQIQIQIADIRAADRSPKPVLPGINLSNPRGRPSINAWA